MGRHHSSLSCTKHKGKSKSKSKSSSHKKHKKHKLPSTGTGISVPTSTRTSTSSKSSKPKRVSFGGVSSDNGPPTHSSGSSRSSSSSGGSIYHQQHHRKSKQTNHNHRHHRAREEHTTTKPPKHHSSAKTKEHSSAKSRSNGKGKGKGKDKGYKPYSSTSGILKSREKHPKRSIPSCGHRITPNTASSSSCISTPTQHKSQPSLKKPTSHLKNPLINTTATAATATKKPTKEPSPPPHPYSTLLSGQSPFLRRLTAFLTPTTWAPDSLHQRTTRLLTRLPAQLHSILTTTLKSLPQINISPSTNKPYIALAAAHKASILARYGNPIPLGVIRKFQVDCREWDTELKGLMLEHEGVQKELVELAREIGVSDDGVDGSGASKEKEEDVEFEEMIKEIKQVGKTYVAKMDKLEKQIFQEEARQNMLMMQAM